MTDTRARTRRNGWRTALAVTALLALAGCGPTTATPQTSDVLSASEPAAVASTIAPASARHQVAFGAPATVAFTLTAAGQPIGEAPVTVTVGDRRIPTTTDGAGAGSVTVAAADLAAGAQAATIRYDGGTTFLAVSRITTIEVIPAAATVALTLTPTATGSTAAAAAVTTATGVEAAGTVEFAVDGAPAGSAPLTAGQAAVEVPAGLPVGDHQVTVSFVPAQPVQIAAATGNGVLTITRAASTATATGHSDTVRYGDRAYVNVAVQSNTPGADLTGPVTLLDGTAVVAEGTTDATGVAELDFLNTADPGAKSYTVSYSGNDGVIASETPFTLQTTQTDVDISIVKPTLKPGGSGTVTVSVIGTPQAPTGTASISVDGVEIANGAVDDSGDISGEITSVAVGSHTIEVSYSGDARFEGSTASATLTVKEPIVNPNADGAAAINADNPCPASAAACVDLSNTRAWLQSGGEVTYGPVSITSGRAGYRTPAGSFGVFWLDRNHKSSLFDDAPMPNSVFFNGGIAFHAGSLSVQSHGCIHLSNAASETFFDTLSVGDRVYVFGSAP